MKRVSQMTALALALGLACASSWAAETAQTLTLDQLQQKLQARTAAEKAAAAKKLAEQKTKESADKEKQQQEKQVDELIETPKN